MRRQRDPGDDLTTGLVRARDEGDGPTTDELFGVLWLMLVAGHETTVHLIGNAVVAPARHPDQLALALAGDRWADVVEETARYRHPVMTTSFRFTLEGVVVAGVPIPRGRAVGVDFDRYGETADRFDITRERTGDLGSGHGPRYCIGASPARLESRLAPASLYRRFPGLSLAIDPDGVPQSPSFFTIGPLSLPVALGPDR